MSENWDLRKLHSVNIKRECILSAVNNSDFFDVHGVVGQEEVKGEEVDISFKGLVVPHNVEAQDVAIVL